MDQSALAGESEVVHELTPLLNQHGESALVQQRNRLEYLSMLPLSEQLSEFSYGYGIVREYERNLNARGIKTVPFLPSLRAEKRIAADAVLKKPGGPIMLQFKLGTELQRFRASQSIPSAPSRLKRPFWRFSVEVTAPNGQFQTLLRHEKNGAQCYYVAPRFSHWVDYAKHYDKKRVLQNSITIKPSYIESNATSGGWHKILYDTSRAFVCSDPIEIPTETEDSIWDSAERMIEEDIKIEDRIRKLVEGVLSLRDGRKSDLDEGIAMLKARLARFREEDPSGVHAEMRFFAQEAFLRGYQILVVHRE